MSDGELVMHHREIVLLKAAVSALHSRVTRLESRMEGMTPKFNRVYRPLNSLEESVMERGRLILRMQRRVTEQTVVLEEVVILIEAQKRKELEDDS